MKNLATWLAVISAFIVITNKAPVHTVLGDHPSVEAIRTLVIVWAIVQGFVALSWAAMTVAYRRDIVGVVASTVASIRANGARWYRTSAILLLNTALLFAAINCGAVGYHRVADATWTPGFIEKYGREAARAIYPDFDDDEINQLLRETWHRGDRYGAALATMKEVPFAGKYVNATRYGYRQNARALPWPPVADRPTVFAFGGSTTWGYGVPDWQTIPAQLADVWTDRDVYNFGRGSYKHANERVLFETLLLLGHRPDVAIFIDGLNELWPYGDDPAASLRAEFNEPANRPRLVLEAVPIIRLPLALRTIEVKSNG